MKIKLYYILFTVILAGIISASNAQEAAPSEANIASSLGMYVFPAEEQSKDQQELDEFTCYKWAREQSGVDPINPPEIEAEQVDRAADGSMVRGGARGAAAGAAIGAIAGDAGKGAAIGAVAGGLRGRRGKVVGDEMEQQQNNAAAAAATEEMMNNFKKAFTACLEGKGYTVK